MRERAAAAARADGSFAHGSRARRTRSRGGTVMTSETGRALDDQFIAQLLHCADTPAGQPLPADAEHLVDALLGALERGAVRAAERDATGTWNAVSWVKRGILLGFRAGRV